MQTAKKGDKEPRLELFKEYFRDFTRDVFPYVIRDDGLAMIGINSTTVGRGAGRLGKIDDDQYERTLTELKIRSRHKIIFLHHNMTRNGMWVPAHGPLESSRKIMKEFQYNGVGLILHGHEHDLYEKPSNNDYPIPQLCAGSTTKVTSRGRRDAQYRIIRVDEDITYRTIGV